MCPRRFVSGLALWSPRRRPPSTHAPLMISALVQRRAQRPQHSSAAGAPGVIPCDARHGWHAACSSRSAPCRLLLTVPGGCTATIEIQCGKRPARTRLRARHDDHADHTIYTSHPTPAAAMAPRNCMTISCALCVSFAGVRRLCELHDHIRRQNKNRAQGRGVVQATAKMCFKLTVWDAIAAVQEFERVSVKHTDGR